MPIATPTTSKSSFEQVPATSGSTLSSIAFTAGRLYLFAYTMDGAQQALDSTFTFSHSGTSRSASWSVVTQVFYGTPRTLCLYRYIPTITETVDLGYTHQGATPASCAYALDEIASGFDSVTPVLQSSRSSGAGVSAITLTLPAGTTAGNLAMCFVASRAASGGVTQRTNWTELSEDLGTGTVGDSGGIEVQHISGANLESTGGASAAGTRSWGAILIEIAAAAATGAAPDTWAMRQLYQGYHG